MNYNIKTQTHNFYPNLRQLSIFIVQFEVGKGSGKGDIGCEIWSGNEII